MVADGVVTGSRETHVIVYTHHVIIECIMTLLYKVVLVTDARS